MKYNTVSIEIMHASEQKMVKVTSLIQVKYSIRSLFQIQAGKHTKIM